MVSFYIEEESKKGRFIAVNSMQKRCISFLGRFFSARTTCFCSSGLSISTTIANHLSIKNSNKK